MTLFNYILFIQCMDDSLTVCPSIIIFEPFDFTFLVIFLSLDISYSDDLVVVRSFCD